MEELENTNSIMGNVNSDNATDASNLEQDPTPEQQRQELSQLFAEDISEPSTFENNASVQDEQTPAVETPNQVETPAQPIVQEVVVQTPEPDFQKELANTSLDSSTNVQAAQQATEQQKARIEQQKLARLKEHEAKAKKSGLTTGILTGILITLLLFVAGAIFAKDYILSAIDYIDSLMPSRITGITSHTQQNYPILDNTEISDETLDINQKYRDRVEEIISSEDETGAKVEQLNNLLAEVIAQENEELDGDIAQYISQKIIDLNAEEQNAIGTISCDVEERCLAQLNRLWEQKHELTCVYTEQDSQEYFIEGNILSKSPSVNMLTTSGETYLWGQDYGDNLGVKQENEGGNIVYKQLSDLSKVIKLGTKIRCTPGVTDKTIFNLPTDIKFVAPEELEEELNKQAEERNEEEYTITHVNSEEEANWVLASHCTDLTCYGEDEEFVACTSFRMIETLDENTPRVSSRGGCKYKDPSELVYVEFPESHNSADTPAESSTLEVSITATPNRDTLGKEIKFESTVNNPDDIVAYEWDFGDGRSMNSQYASSVSHIYGEKGVYTIKLTVYDRNGNNNTATESVTILEEDETINE